MKYIKCYILTTLEEKLQALQRAMNSVSIYIVLWYGLGRQEIVRGKGGKHGSAGLDLHCLHCATSLSGLIPPEFICSWKQMLGDSVETFPWWGGLTYPCAGALPPPLLRAAGIWQHVLWSTFIISLAWSPLHGKVRFIRHGSDSADLTNIQGNGKG